MVPIFILSLALFSGATAFHLEGVVTSSNVTSNSTGLQQFPWTVQVDFLNVWGWAGWTQHCAATVLNSRYVLSATSCFSGASYSSPHSRRIRAGANHRHAGGVIVYVEREINYQQSTNNATNGTFFHDISVVRLSSRLVLSSLIQQGAIVAPHSVIPGGVELKQVGWGLRNDSLVALSGATVTTLAWNQTLANATAPILRAYPSANARVNGDVGGPWVLGNVIVGIVSGANVAAGGSWADPLVAASVTAYTDWIVRVAV